MFIQKLIDIVKNKKGIEIGGPSSMLGAIKIYENAKSMDNIIFSDKTVWSNHLNNEYNYYKNKKGIVYINDAVNITCINEPIYDFVFASHVLEHIANPIKALNEWLKMINIGGYLILVLPEKTACFDHKRPYSSFSTILKQYENNVDEDDLSMLPEILQLHDLSKDPLAGTFQKFKQRSLKNIENRCLHHYVYCPELLHEICCYLKCNFITTFTKDINIWYIMQK
jgi:2-polyprenyl-3-methyl-5-hydroxy-6-metoxy-1,4-benzoquinol methylase